MTKNFITIGKYRRIDGNGVNGQDRSRKILEQHHLLNFSLSLSLSVTTGSTSISQPRIQVDFGLWKRLHELSSSQRFRGDSVVASILDKLPDIKLIPTTFVVDLWLVDWQSGFASVLSRSLEPGKAFFGDGRARWNDPTSASRTR